MTGWNPVDDARARWIARQVLPHEPALRARIRRLVASIPGLDVDDVVQQSYAALVELDDFERIENARAYVFTVARSMVLQHVRRARIVPIEAVAEIDRLDIVSDERSPERHAEAVQDMRRMMQVLAALPGRCREAFLLRKVEGLSQREIAKRMGISENTVEKHIVKGLRFVLDSVTTTEGNDASATAATRRRNARKQREQD